MIKKLLGGAGLLVNEHLLLLTVLLPPQNQKGGDCNRNHQRGQTQIEQASAIALLAKRELSDKGHDGELGRMWV